MNSEKERLPYSKMESWQVAALLHWLLISIISLQNITFTSQKLSRIVTMEGDAKTSTTAGALSVPEAGTLVCPVTNWLINSFSMMRETIPSLFKSFKPCPGGGGKISLPLCHGPISSTGFYYVPSNARILP
jgi:hypothetical protein